MAHRPRNVLVLAGDHVYLMDYKTFNETWAEWGVPWTTPDFVWR